MNFSNQITRGDFLKLAGAVLFSGASATLLAACGVPEQDNNYEGPFRTHYTSATPAPNGKPVLLETSRELNAVFVNGAKAGVDCCRVTSFPGAEMRFVKVIREGTISHFLVTSGLLQTLDTADDGSEVYSQNETVAGIPLTADMVSFFTTQVGEVNVQSFNDGALLCHAVPEGQTVRVDWLLNTTNELKGSITVQNSKSVG